MATQEPCRPGAMQLAALPSLLRIFEMWDGHFWRDCPAEPNRKQPGASQHAAHSYLT